MIRMSNEPNIIKKTAKELGMTYKELGEAIGYSESAISNSSRMNKPSKALQKSIMMYLENRELKLKVELLNQGLENDKTRAYDEMAKALRKFVNIE